MPFKKPFSFILIFLSLSCPAFAEQRISDNWELQQELNIIKQELDNLSTKMTEENKLSAFICQIKADSQNNLLSLIEPYVDEESSIKYHNLVKDHGFISPEIAEFLTEQSDKFSGPDAVLLLNIPELIYKKIITQESKKASPDKTLLSEALDGYETVAEEIWKKTPEGEGPSKKQARILREIKMYKNKFGL
jgi:hypothetical protein